MNEATIKKGLTDYDQTHVETYIRYLAFISTAKKKGELKNPWVSNRPDSMHIQNFKRVAADDLVFDGVHITLQKTGISYDYVAYKNKMFLKYPESIIDVQLVTSGDEFKFSKVSGAVIYTHNINNPFGSKDADIIGGYCVIKNKRGEFLTILSVEDIEKHRKVAKTDFIWADWFPEMCLKTVIKKACKQHFADIFQNIETIDNGNCDIELPLDISLDVKQEIESLETEPELNAYYQENKNKHAGVHDSFITLLSKRKEVINGNL